MYIDFGFLKKLYYIENLSGQIKLCDFGESRVVDIEDAKASTQVGTLFYWPPERVSGDRVTYDIRSDIWSLGITLFEIILGKLPFFINSTTSSPESLEIDAHYFMHGSFSKIKFDDIIEDHIRHNYSINLCEVLKLCTLPMEIRPYLTKLIDTDLYREYHQMSENEVEIIILRYKVRFLE